jgi:hypothetical protein
MVTEVFTPVANSDVWKVTLAARLITGRLFLFCPPGHCLVCLGDGQHHPFGSGIGYLFGLASDLLRKSSPLLGVIRNLRHKPYYRRSRNSSRLRCQSLSSKRFVASISAATGSSSGISRAAFSIAAPHAQPNSVAASSIFLGYEGERANQDK